jgi:NAD+ synthase (glutamine-hydrolysing)
MSSLTIALAQLNTYVGDIPGNTQKVIQFASRAVTEFAADAVIFPELTLTGYPPEDLLLRPSLDLRIENALSDIMAAKLPLAIIVGYPKRIGGQLFNMAGVIQAGELIAEYAKQHLPNYQVFDEKRYFIAGDQAVVFNLKGVPTAITVCEDIWYAAPMAQAKAAGAKLMLNLNASPYHQGKQIEREAIVAARAQEGAMPVVYVNLVGGQDELVFDGGSVIVDANGQTRLRAPTYEEDLFIAQLDITQAAVIVPPQNLSPIRSNHEAVYQALVLGMRGLGFIGRDRFGLNLGHGCGCFRGRSR